MSTASPRPPMSLERSKRLCVGSLIRSLIGFGTGRTRPTKQRFNHRRSRIEHIEDRALLDADCFRISEYMAVTRSTLQDADGDYSDWIEIENTCSTSASLAGWKLSDGESAPWMFPNRTVAGGGRLVVFASGKDRAGADLHTSFGLENDVLTRRSPAGVTVSQYQTLSSSQVADVSYGIAPDGTNGFLATPTPGSPNAMALAGLLSKPEVYVDCLANGLFAGIVIDATNCAPQVTISAQPSVTVYYTTDGSEPSPQNPASVAYVAPPAL